MTICLFFCPASVQYLEPENYVTSPRPVPAGRVGRPTTPKIPGTR
ncbi:hypothetical protein J2W76_004874 [Methylorubrum zatmanii]|nr:hypothetical protein [Methylorubrum extorquens]MCP1551550.1 hypothetical protein [Methylorubrum zatmanii]MCP1556487.1 hypothetical protein [Methylorubrum extorquens]MCP1581852.1 hypothetical protein [Methylorubrum extorquens]